LVKKLAFISFKGGAIPVFVSLNPDFLNAVSDYR